MNNALLLCVSIGLFWAGAPLVGRLSAVNAMMMTVLIAVGSLAINLPAAFTQDWSSTSPRAIAFGLVAGLLNGAGLLLFYRLVAGSSEGLWDLSRVIPLAFVLVAVCSVFGARIFYGETLSTDKIIGLGLAASAIWFLK